MAGALTAMIAAAFAGGVTPDPYFEYTTLLLPGNGTNGAQNNTFLDGSTNNFTITRNGNTTQGTFSPFSQTGWGNYFDGTGDYLTFNPSTAINIGTSDFTIEAWVYHTGGVDDAIYSNSGAFTFGYGATGFLRFYLTTGTNIVDSSTAFISNQWTHVCVSRASGTLRMFQNGTLVATSSSYPSIGNSSSTSYIGRYYGGSSNDWQGYISNLRIVVGTAVYTSAFTPPTSPLTAISGTSLLTCQSNRFIDNSTNNFTITVNGNTSVVAFSPFNPTASWSAATYGGSGYFDGSGDYLQGPTNAAFTMGTGDFTIELWYYPIVDYVSGDAYLFDLGTNGTRIEIINNKVYFFAVAGSGITGTTGQGVLAGTWYHIAGVRAGSTITMYLNGSSIGSTTNISDLTDTACRIGAYGGGGYGFNGYIANFRIVKGTAVYTGAFTPPSLAPLTTAGSTSAAAYPSTTNVNTSFASSATSLLLNFTNAGIYDATSKNDLETVADAQISNTTAKWGSTSIKFDGTGDWLDALASNQLFNLSSGDWTIEAWIYRNASGAAHTILSLYNTAGSNSGLTFYVNASNQLVTDNGVTAALAAGTVASGQWVYVAIVRSGSTTTGYINGSSVGTTAQAPSASQYARIGALATGASAFNGYIQDLRITKGYARTITTPTAAFPTL